MKRMLGISLACFLAAGAWSLAQEQPQEKKHSETTTKRTGPGPDVKTKSESVTGTVKEYDAGKKIKVSGPNDKTYTFELDENARVDGTIVVGQTARVEYTKDNDGKEHVTVLSSGKKAVGEATMPRSHSTMTSKHKEPGAHETKVKTGTVVGVVKEYDAGKKIVVEGPKKKDYSFDLDQNASVKGSVAVGERVKVTYKKTDGGDRVTVISRYTRKV